ncbi:recombinase RecT [uncultured Chryseobacterium sp.]|uniref:recombinase RecT n=1 Tax=uncultured Chryseobacterium sp. TaxID=259322 RepID=UPI0025DDAC47|nr:recombinase RecT [uncultured Chryseobacterium sp.]
MSQENNTQLEKVKKDISAQVLAKVDAFTAAGELRIPKDYSPENALKSAYLLLTEAENSQKKPVLEVCTKESIANALLKMVVWGLSPMKKQCDFIPYGNKLECSIEYTGNIVLAKRFGGLKDIKARAIFKQDQFEFEVNPETGKSKIISHKQTLESLGSKDVVGAYAVIDMVDGSKDVEIMSMQQIRDAWNQGAMKGNSPAHKNFPDQMAMKTVINRACKLLIRGSDDAILYDDEEKNPPVDRVSEDVKQDIRENANKETISFDDAEDAKFEEVKGDEVKEDEAESVNEGPQF